MLTKYLLRNSLTGFSILACLTAVTLTMAGVPQGSPEKAEAYYKKIARVLEFRDPATILDSKLDDVLTYVGYKDLSARDLEALPSEILMDPAALNRNCAQRASAASCPSFNAGDILSSRFFAPKIINVNDPPEKRALGWRKLIRLRTRPNSIGATHGIEKAIILFNFFTSPGETPFNDASESVNTQVMLITAGATDSNDALYWLDYGPLSKGGTLSLQLPASFDAADLQAKNGTKPFFVPTACVACHGENDHRALVNYLDTDHWFDRLESDFETLRQQNVPLLFDAHTNDPTTPEFAHAFEVIREFNQEAVQQAASTQPKGFHLLSAQTWLRLHEKSTEHFNPIERPVPSSTMWSAQSSTDEKLLNKLNQYCFRCHGTIRFNVFDKAAVNARKALFRMRMRPSDEQLKEDPDFLMPPDRKLADSEIKEILKLLH